MTQNRKKMRPEFKKISMIVLMVVLITAISTPGYSQDELPAVEIDMSILDAIDPSAGQVNRYSRPVQAIKKPSYPFLTAPEDLAEETPPPPPHGIIHFPVQVREQTEEYDPSISTVPLDDIRPAKKQASSMAPPLPSLKPIASAPHVKQVKVPLPPRRPSLQIASKEFVRRAKEEFFRGKIMDSAIKMPAVPAEHVKKEPLPHKNPPGIILDDPLAKTLVTPDKKMMVKSIEAITALADALMPTAQPSQPAEQRTVKSVPKTQKVQKSKTVQTMAKPLEKDTTSVTRMAKIEPAAGDLKIAALPTDIPDISEPIPARIPRMPPDENYEKEYISLPFQQGLIDLDDKTLKELESNIVPLLKNNEDLRLQIQAFASRSGEQIGSARRTSLSRALSIRSYLLDQGVEARRMDVRALGMQTDRNPLDRVDFVFFDPAG